MNQAQLNAMIEQASESEKRQFKATANVYLNNLREKMRRERAIAERKIELGVNKDENPKNNITG